MLGAMILRYYVGSLGEDVRVDREQILAFQNSRR